MLQIGILVYHWFPSELILNTRSELDDETDDKKSPKNFPETSNESVNGTADLDEYESEILQKFNKLMKQPKYQRMYNDIMKSRKAKIRKERFERVRVQKRYDPLALQLPTVIVAGAKKCGTKGSWKNLDREI